MPLRRPVLIACAALASGAVLAAPPLPYDESANAQDDIAKALADAAQTRRQVLVIFGANWCADCRALDASLKTAHNAELMAREFVVVKVDVGNFDRNGPVTTRYGNPTRKGIPSAVLLSPTHQVLYATRAGELSNARRMSDSGVYEFFTQAAAAARSGKS
jgi:thioredoxin 1